jgi:hypothetical protein
MLIIACLNTKKDHVFDKLFKCEGDYIVNCEVMQIVIKSDMKIHSFMTLDSKLSYYGGACDESFRMPINTLFPFQDVH